MFNNKFKSLKSVVYAVALLSVIIITGAGVDKVEASVLEKLTSLRLYVSQDSSEASVIGSFNNGGTPGLHISSSKVVIGDAVYVGSSPGDSSRVLTEKDLEKIKADIYERLYEEFKVNGCVK